MDCYGILTWILCHHRYHSKHHLLLSVHLFSYCLLRMWNFPCLFHQSTKKRKHTFWDHYFSAHSANYSKKTKFICTFNEEFHLKSRTHTLTLSFSSNFKLLKRDSMFESGLSLLVGDPPNTYSTILKPKPPAESRGLWTKNGKKEEQNLIVNFNSNWFTFIRTEETIYWMLQCRTNWKEKKNIQIWCQMEEEEEEKNVICVYGQVTEWKNDHIKFDCRILGYFRAPLRSSIFPV